MDINKWRVKKTYWGWSVYRPGIQADDGDFFGPTLISSGWSWRQAFAVALERATR